MMLEIPTDSASDWPYWEQETALEGQTYTLVFEWSFRAEAWFLSVLDADRDPISSSRRVVVNWLLLRLCQDSRRPPGEIVALDEAGAGDPGRDELGSRVRLYYLTAAEAAEARAL